MIEFQAHTQVFFDLPGLILAHYCLSHTHTHTTHHIIKHQHRLKVDRYLLNRLPNKKRLIPLQACIKTLEAWRRSNIHHN